MKSIEIYALDIFLRIRKRIPPVYHKSVMSQILGVYCPWQWPLLTTEERHHFQNLEIMTETAKALNEILTPVHLNGRIELIPYYCDKQEVLDARKELYGGAIKLDPNQDGVGISSTIKLHPDQDGIDILSTIAPLESKGDHLPEYRLKDEIMNEVDPEQSEDDNHSESVLDLTS